MFITLNGAKVFFDVYGSQLALHAGGIQQKPTLIVLHGGHGFADHTLYVEFWAQFQDIVQVIFMDQHGCGRSDRGTPASWNMSRWASDVRALCDALGIEKPILAGVSMGGHVIGEYVRHYAETLGGLILCNTEARMNAAAVAEQFVKHGHPNAAAACLALFQHPSEETFQAYAQHCLPLYAKNAYSLEEKKRCIGNKPVFLHYLQYEANTLDYRADFTKVRCPTLIMAGERGSHTAAAAEEMAACIPAQYCTYQLFLDAGSPVYKDEPLIAEQAVRCFLKALHA